MIIIVNDGIMGGITVALMLIMEKSDINSSYGCGTSYISLGVFTALKREKMVREAARDKQYAKTLILNLAHDFVHIDKDTNCAGKENCRVVPHSRFEYAVQFRDDAIDTLKMLQQVAPHRDRWELIIWTDKDQHFAEEIAKILSEKGVQIAHVVGGDQWDIFDDDDHRFDKVNKMLGRDRLDITRLANDQRPLHSMIIVHNRPGRCLPYGNTVGIRPWYGHNKSLEVAYEWLKGTLEKQEQTMFIDLSLTWPTFGSDDAMKQLKGVLDELNGQNIKVKTLNDVIFSAPATKERVSEQKQMVFFQSADGSQRFIETKYSEPRREWRPLTSRRAE